MAQGFAFSRKRSNPDGLTAMLRRVGLRNDAASTQVADVIYPELRKIAAAHMNRERPGHVLQPTALVSEAYLRLLAHENHNWHNRTHFFGAAAQIMRRILVDYARKQRGRQMVPLDDAVGSDVRIDRTIDLLALDHALSELEAIAPQQARVVELRYFADLPIREVAELLGCSPRTVDAYWSAARKWLYERLTS